jgi:hypothetical protein
LNSSIDLGEQEIPLILWTWADAYKQLKKSGDLNTLKSILSAKSYAKN